MNKDRGRKKVRIYMREQFSGQKGERKTEGKEGNNKHQRTMHIKEKT